MTSPAWTRVFPVDPLPLLAASAEPTAHWIALTSLTDHPATDCAVVRAHATVLADPLTQDLLDRITPWDSGLQLSGHHVPAFAPNALALLADFGVTAADDPRIATLQGDMLAHQAPNGRFLAFARWRDQPGPVWAALPCDSHAILETLARAGFTDDPRVERAFVKLAADLVTTPQGCGWSCLPDPKVPFRGPGRKGDTCPQVTVQALRAFSYLPAQRQPATVIAAGRTLLGIWRDRANHQPYMFGHGRRFKQVKWPATWYSSLAVVDTLGRFPALWEGPDADGADRRALAEIAACLIAYNVGPDGRVVPHSTFRGFAAHTFGQKKQPSDYALARIAVALRRLESLSEDIRAVDVTALGSSKGGSGTVLPPV